MTLRIDGKPLKELSDEELDEELRRRRQARGYEGGAVAGRRGSSRSAPKRAGRTPGWKLRQWYRNLELERGASRDEIELAFVRLSEKYHPDRHTDPDKKRLARRLAGGLTEAYRGILEDLDSRD